MVELAFERKYFRKYYNLHYGKDQDDEDDEDDRSYQDVMKNKSFNKVILTKYGKRLRWIDVCEAEEEILDLIERNCNHLERVKLLNVPRMIELKDLKEISLLGVRYLDEEELALFISSNQQLEALTAEASDWYLIDELDKWQKND